MSKIATRPTTAAARETFAALDPTRREAAKVAAQKALDSGATPKDAWEAGLASVRRSSGVAGKTFTRLPGHRLHMLSKYAECECGVKHRVSQKDGQAAQRAAHEAHKRAVVAKAAKASAKASKAVAA